jgi:Tfp pilus assembly protein PilF
MKVISAIVGIILLGASFTLAYLSNSNATKMLANKDAIVMKYIDNSNKALENEDIKGAIKFAKSAIKADPSNKEAYKTLENIYMVKYKPNEDEEENTKEQPSEDEEEEEDMGC